MPNYKEVNIDDRGPEPTIRIRTKVTNENDLITYIVTQEDVERIHRFTLASIALRFFGDEDLDWIIRDVNDNILDDRRIKVRDRIKIPRHWQRIAESNKRSLPTARIRATRPGR